jgi:UDP-glucose 4-epimerase
MKKILITGNSGYIGSHLTKIAKINYQIVGLDKNTPICKPDNFYSLDITKNFCLEDEFDCVIHLAAEVAAGRSVSDPALYYNTNINGTLNVLNNIKAKRFIHASTGCAEFMNNPYGISKKASEEIVTEFCQKNNIPFTIFRFYNVTGKDGFDPTNPDGLLWNLIKAKETGVFNLFGEDYNTLDGSAVRDYVHVNEICYSIMQVIENSTNNIENLGHGIGVTVKQMIELFKKINNCDFEVKVCPRRVGDLEISVLDNPSKLMKKLYNIGELLKI